MNLNKLDQHPKFHVKDEAFYQRLAEGCEGDERLQEFVIPKETGRAFVVEKGQVLRVIEVEGPQVQTGATFDVVHSSKDDPRPSSSERLSLRLNS